jgi:hypothetical protein
MNTPIIAVIVVVAFMVGNALSVMNKACKSGYHARRVDTSAQTQKNDSTRL